MIVRFFSALLLAWIIGFAWFGLFLPRAAPLDTVTDAVVVLTGGAKRIERGLEVVEADAARRMLISGVDRDVKPAELAELYGDPASFACCVDLGFRSVDTRSNALETARWAARHEVASLRIVTGDWHMRRARLELELALGKEIALVTDAVPTRPTLMQLFLEYNKYIVRGLAALIGI